MKVALLSLMVGALSLSAHAFADSVDVTFIVGGMVEKYGITEFDGANAKYHQEDFDVSECKINYNATSGKSQSKDCLEGMLAAFKALPKDDVAKNTVDLKQNDGRYVVTETEVDSDGEETVRVFHGQMIEGSVADAKAGGKAVLKLDFDEFMTALTKKMEAKFSATKISAKTSGDSVLILSGDSLEMRSPRIELTITVSGS